MPRTVNESYHPTKSLYAATSKSAVWFVLLCITTLTGCQSYFNHVGFIDKTGTLTASLDDYQCGLFDTDKSCCRQASDFSDGLSMLQVDNGKGREWAFLDAKGQVHSFGNFYLIDSFFDGLAACNKTESGPYGFIDKQGTMVIPTIYRAVEHYSEGVAACLGKDGWIFIDRSGKQAFEGSFDTTQPFSEGLACVMKKGKWGCIDKRGHFVIQPKYGQIFPCSNGIVVARETCIREEVSPNCSEGATRQFYFDKNGKELFQKDCAPVRLKFLYLGGGNTAMHIDGKSGPGVVSGSSPCEVMHGPSFSSDRAVVSAGKKCGYIDKSGEICIPAIYDYAFAFTDDIALVYSDEDGGRFGYIDKHGAPITPISFYHAASFSEGYAVVSDKKNGGFYFIDKNGKRAFPQIFASYARSFHDGMARVGMPAGGECL